MSDAGRTPAQIIGLPEGGGAINGIGEKFAPDPQTGTGNLTVPIIVPPGRLGRTPPVQLSYSTGHGNGYFGLGWALPVPEVARKTSHGVPRYRGDDTYILSGADDLVPVGRLDAQRAVYRPRTEGLFAQIVHRIDPAGRIDEWIVATKDGLISRYGASTAHPDDRTTIFRWQLVESTDSLGNRIVYEYDIDAGQTDGHRWRQPLLRRIRYAPDLDDPTRFLASVAFDYQEREDAFSDRRAGFEIRTSMRCHSITTRTHAGKDRLVRRYEFGYDIDPYDGVSLLNALRVAGFDDEGTAHYDLPAVTFRYGRLQPERRSFRPVGGRTPATAMARGDYQVVDVTGDGLPDILQLDGGARLWRNLGAGRFAEPRTMRSAPAGLTLADRGVQLLDADGNGRADLMVSTPTMAGTFPLRYDANWGTFQPYRRAPSFSLDDPEVRLIDLDGNGITDALRSGARLECWFYNRETGWYGPRLARPAGADGPPPLSLADPRVKLADMTGDNLQDIVLIHGRTIRYWPSLGHGIWGDGITMRDSPALPYGFDPSRVLLGDVDGDGVADLVHLGDDEVTVWFNRSGNGWSDPVVIRGVPVPPDARNARLIDLLGTGTSGVLFSRDLPGDGRPSMHFLDLTGGVKPRLLSGVDNGIGALVEVDYAPSTRYAVTEPEARWRTALPIVVPVVAQVRTYDQVSRGKLVTTFDYRHGHWDGVEREFRGFGRVDQTDTQIFTDYHAGDPGVPVDVAAVDPAYFAPPVRTRTWFHLGPVDADDSWTEPDWRDEYWTGDPPLLRHTEKVDEFLATMPDRATRRNALRTLRGSILRTEVYAEDGDPRPFAVTEYAYDLRAEVPGAFFPFRVAERSTRWDRGDDPMTRFTYTSDYDAFGQSRRRTEVALPRRSALRQTLTGVAVDETAVLATHVRTTYAVPTGAAYLFDRVSEVRSYELVAPARVSTPNADDLRSLLAEQARIAALVEQIFRSAAGVRLFGHAVNHYDGNAFTGLPCGHVDDRGLRTLARVLVHTDETLHAAYGVSGFPPVPASAPPGFGLTGHHRDPAGPGYLPGRYADTLSQEYDAAGLVTGIRDPLGALTTVTPDPFHLYPSSVTTPTGLTTTADYNYRTGAPASTTEPNGVTTHYRYHALGLLECVYLEESDGSGGDPERPEKRYVYRLDSLPISASTITRIWHAADDVSDDTMETREYSDGFSRVVQRQAQAEQVTFPDDAGLLGTEPGTAGAPATGQEDPERIVVSGWQGYDNKGRVVERYEPFFASSWGFVTSAEARWGGRTRLFYDPLGRLIRIVDPDGSERRVVHGIPATLSTPQDFAPTPWVTTSYDANDLARLTGNPGSVPVRHHFTPVIAVSDALGRVVASLTTGGAGGHLIRTGYDIRGNVRFIRDELGREASSTEYDLINQPCAASSLDTGRVETVLDAAGRPIQTTDARECVTLRTYDSMGRPTAVYAAETPGTPVTQRERLRYGDEDTDQAAARREHRIGRLWRHHDEAGLVELATYTFTGLIADQLRWVISDDAIVAAEPSGWSADWRAPDAENDLDPQAHRIRTRYDALGRVVRLELPAGPGQTAVVEPAYGRSGTVRSVTVDGVPHLRMAARNARGQRILAEYGNGLMIRFAYHPDNHRITRMRTERAEITGNVRIGTSPAFQDLTYTYDLVGNPVTIEERVAGCGVASAADGPNRLVRTFGYDAFYRLSTATGRACAGIGTLRPLEDATRCGSFPGAANQLNAPALTTGYRESYRYDAAGSLVDLGYTVTTGAHRPTWHRTYELEDGANRPTSVRNGAGGVPLTLGYDDAGNLTSSGEAETLAWDHAGRLRGFRRQAGDMSSVSARYLYSADGTRIKKWVRRGGVDESMVQLGGMVERHTWNGGGNTVVHVIDGADRIGQIRYGPARPGDASPAVKYEFGDHLGSVTLAVDEHRAWVNREEFFPYGETSFGGFRRKRYRFTGKERDEESGLTWHGARYYAPALCRWTAPDPAGRVDGLNLYLFVRGSPMRYVDPLGTQATETESQTPATPSVASQVHRGFQKGFGGAVDADTAHTFSMAATVLGALAALTGSETLREESERFATSSANFAAKVEAPEGGAESFGAFFGGALYSTARDAKARTQERVAACVPSSAATPAPAHAATTVAEHVAAPTTPASRPPNRPPVSAPAGGDPPGPPSEENIVYRVIRPDENPSVGLVAKNPAATHAPETHVAKGSREGFASQWISTTRDRKVAEEWLAKTPGARMVGIDLAEVSSPTVDYSTLKGRLANWPSRPGAPAWNFAGASSEVLILKYVPPPAVFSPLH